MKALEGATEIALQGPKSSEKVRRALAELVHYEGALENLLVPQCVPRVDRGAFVLALTSPHVDQSCFRESSSPLGNQSNTLYIVFLLHLLCCAPLFPLGLSLSWGLCLAGWLKQKAIIEVLHGSSGKVDLVLQLYQDGVLLHRSRSLLAQSQGQEVLMMMTEAKEVILRKMSVKVSSTF